MLKRLFIKDYNNVKDGQVRERYGVVAGTFGIITNLVVCIFKIIVGILSASITIIADGVNNLTDAGSSVLTLIGFKLSGRPADKEHPYGHERYENIMALFISIIIFAVGVIFLKTSIEKVVSGEGVSNITVFTYIVLGFAILLKFIQMLVYFDFSKAIESDALKASGIDSRNDILATLSALISVILMDAFSINIDAYTGLLVSAFIIYSGLKMLIETISPLLGVMPSKEVVEQLKNIILSEEKILGVHDIIIHEYGKTNHFASLHVEVDCNEDIIEIHDIIDNLERQVYSEMNIKLSIHLDPVDVHNEKRGEYLERVTKVLLGYDKNAKFHDFRVVEGVTHTNIVFDLIIPFDKRYDMQEITRLLEEEFSCGGKFYFVIETESEYI